MKRLLAVIDVVCLLIIFRFKVKELTNFVNFVTDSWRKELETNLRPTIW